MNLPLQGSLAHIHKHKSKERLTSMRVYAPSTRASHHRESTLVPPEPLVIESLCSYFLSLSQQRESMLFLSEPLAIESLCPFLLSLSPQRERVYAHVVRASFSTERVYALFQTLLLTRVYVLLNSLREPFYSRRSMPPSLLLGLAQKSSNFLPTTPILGSSCFPSFPL